ncbi:GNAT family N-acetyltransferase [Bradyrhizobium canariense]|uniref:Acetyltransferase (GNAT) family protein n=1 Tax=Bradyrhizobium canariense TaxID=255045 RepID=A0A1H1U529_9BRAD|nr:GNAT family N-acetyltransferase [Bradyrhizobium canariense]SDS67477.1 Acetyltransferase (GNAT) family protein [Bradyrhizobium canariense]
MAVIDEPAIVRLDPSDALAGLALSAEAHWNQNEADWRFFLSKGTVFGVRDKDGQLVATAALLPYTSSDAWISMVLVTASWRRRGLATRLVDACLDTATKRGLTTWLDATPAGAAVYGPLGFTPTLQLRRLRLESQTPAQTRGGLSACDLTEFAARDISAMGFDRGDLLSELSARPASRVLSNGAAMSLVRDGRAARHIGPLFADDPESALALVDEIARNETRPVLIDAVTSQSEFLDGLTNSGWTSERPFQRMRFGRATTQAADLPFAVAGPEYG